ncbi:MAG: terminase family protein [Myxococcales bacterium]
MTDFAPVDLTRCSIVERLVMELGAQGLHDALTPEERVVLPYVREAWERPSIRLPAVPPRKEPGFGRWSGQQEPPGKWLFWIACGGRGVGKSWLLTQFVLSRAQRFPGCRIAAVARTAGAMWSEIVEGKAGLLAFSPRWFAPKVQANKRQLVYPNGSLVKLFTAEEPDTLRGPNNDFGAVDELCAMKYAEEMWRQLQMTMRSGSHPQTMVATTPRPLKLLIRLVEDPRSAVTIGRSYENRANVAPSWLDENVRPYVGTAFGRQEVDGEILDEMPGALFERKWFDRDTWCPDWRKESKYKRIGVGVDPAETSGEHADNWGIIAAGLREDGLIEVLEDATLNATPDAAAKAAVDCYWKHGASFMVADVGRSGQLVESVIKLTDSRVRVLKKGGNKGKRAWAESAAVLYGKHLVFHSPGLEKLENECCRWTDDVPKSEWSPDRMDALAYVLAELATKGAPPTVTRRPNNHWRSERDFVPSGTRDFLNPRSRPSRWW